jgi:hypothetical protein
MDMNIDMYVEMVMDMDMDMDMNMDTDTGKTAEKGCRDRTVGTGKI